MTETSPEWISHRGLSDEAADGVVENTLKAFELAVADGFDWLETDLRISNDEDLFLQHDPSLLRTSGTDVIAETLSSSALRQVTLNDGQPLAFFRDFIDRFEDNHWVLDIKPEQGDRILASLINDYFDIISARTDRIWFQVWEPRHRSFLIEHLPGAQLFASMQDCYRSGLRALTGIPLFGRIQENTLYALPPKFIGIDLYNARMCEAYASQGAQLLAFLPETDHHIKQAMALPYRYILTNQKRSAFC